MTIDTSKNKAAVIQKIDKDFPEWLDFTALRNEGLHHIGALSGKLWTDHNIHDPGITTLEVLSYAILDLGYRTSRPIENLLAPTSSGKDDNFFTANQILTNNPLTITDYRKLLLSLPEIRNAWLTVSDASKLYINKSQTVTINGLYKITLEPNFDWVKTNPTDTTDTAITPSVFRPKISHSDLIKKVNKLLNAHRNLCEDFEGFPLISNETDAANQSIDGTGQSRILSADPLVIKGSILLNTQADTARVYAAIHRAIAEFIAPSPRFYTLQELLDKGKTIEEIYEGRPSMTVQFPTLQATLQALQGRINALPSNLDEKEKAKRINQMLTESLISTSTFSELNTGFIDTDELQNIQPRKEIHISDLYNLVSQIEGVQSVQSLQLEKSTAGQSVSKNWCYKITEGSTPVLQDLVLSLKKGVTTETRTVNDLSNFEKNGGNQRNGVLTAEPLPYGAPLTDLGDYYSIQRDYPRVYRIGDGGLPSKAPDEDVAQVRQFKGYLLFFERILTDYLAQLTHVRDVFSITPDADRSAEQKRTYFTGSLDNVPDINMLLRFADSKDGQATLTTALAIPTEGGILTNVFDELIKTYKDKPIEQQVNTLDDILSKIDFLDFFAKSALIGATNGTTNLQPQTFKTAFQRNAVMNLLRRNLENDHFETTIYEDAYGFFFTVVPTIGKAILLSRSHYATRKAAQEAAALTALVGAFSTGFRLVNHPNTLVKEGVTIEPFYTFDIVSSPAENLDLLNQTLENPSLYAQRRNILLDHLLARFAEQFTDYSILMYQVFKDKTEDTAQTAHDKARYLKHYDTLSQNRARAFDYTEGGWLSDNTSGFEQRLKALAGIKDLRRRTLCPFDIDFCDDEFQVKITDSAENTLFETTDAFPKELAETIVPSFTEGGQSADNFVPFQTATKEFGFAFKTPMATLTHPILYASETDRDTAAAAIYALFRQKRVENEVFIFSTLWQIGLYPTIELPNLTFERATSLAHAPLNDAPKQPIQVGKTRFKTADDALRNTVNFTKNLQKEGLMLHADPQQEGVFINTAAFEPVISTLPPVYRWHIYDNTTLKESGTVETPDEATALTDFIAAKTVEGVTICENIRIFEAEEAHQWSIVVNKEILLNSSVLFSDKQKAASTGRTARELCREARFFTITEETNGKATLSLHNEADVIVATAPNPFASAKLASAFQERIILWANQKGIQIKTMRFASKSYNFDIQDDKNTPILRGYNVFKNREEALSKSFEVFTLSKDTDAFYKSGDEANPDYTFLLKDKAQQVFIAQNPQVFETAKEREAVVEQVQALLKNAQIPVQIKAEAPRYVWTLADTPTTGENSEEEGQTLKSFAYFDSPANAEADFNGTLHIADKTANYKIRPSTPNLNAAYLLDIQRDNATCATITTEFTSREDGEKAIGQWVKRIANNRYTVQTQEQPDRYKFQYFLFATDTTPLFISEKDFGSTDEAATGFADFVRDLQAKTLKDNSLQTASGEVVARLSGDAEQAKVFMDDVKKLRNTEGLIVSSVQKSARSNEGTYTYRMLNKDEPLALARIRNAVYVEANLDKAKDELAFFRKKNSRECPVLTLCLDGDNVLSIGNQWHYVLKVHHSAETTMDAKLENDTMLWVSWMGYDTEADAHAAFQENYVGDITAAINKANYDPTSEENKTSNWIFYDKNDRDTEGYPKSLHSTGRRSRYRLFVLKTAADTFSIDELTAFAQSYPLREEAETRVDDNGNRLKQYSFVLYDCKSGSLDWKSTALFDAPDAALAAWHRFYTMLGSGGACRLSMTDNCQYNIGVFEILLESEHRFQDMNDWTHVDKLANASSKTNALYLYHDDNRIAAWSFWGVDTCFRLATSPLQFSSPQECKAFLAKTVSVFQLKPTDSTTKQPQEAFYTPIEPDTMPVPCGCEPPTGTPNLKPNDPITVLTFLDLGADCLTTDLANFITKEKNYRIIQAPESTAYSFELVDDTHILARHPQAYTTQLEAEAALKRADACLNTEGVHFIEKILLRPRNGAGTVNVTTNCRLPYLNDADICTPSIKNDVPIYDCEPCDAAVTPTSASIIGDTPPQQQTDYYIPDADPYSFTIKVVMPAWGRRFGNTNFTKELERFFAYEAPAHIWLDIEGKTPQQLFDFEAEYRQWLCQFNTIPQSTDFLSDNQLSGTSLELSATSGENQAVDSSINVPTVDNRTATKPIETAATTSALFLPIDNKENRLEKSIEAATNSAASDTQTIQNNAFVQQRLTHYQEAISSIADAKLLKTESYKQTAFFLKSDGNLKALDMLVDLITHRSLNKKGGATDAQYTALLQNAVGYALDKWLISAPDAVQHADILRGLFEKMKAQNVDVQELIKDWKGDELVKQLDKKVAPKYKAIIDVTRPSGRESNE